MLFACSVPNDAATGDASTPDANAGANDANANDANQTCPNCFEPTPSMRWQYQLQGDPNPSIASAPYGGGASVTPDVFDVDLYASDGTTPG